MKPVRKLQVQRFTRILITFIVMSALVFLLLAASKNQMEQPLRGYNVRLNDEHEYSVIQKRDIENWLLKNDLLRPGQPIGRLDLEKIERLVETNPWIEDAEIFVDNRKVLQIDLVQRSPVARVFTDGGSAFYLDSNLKEMPVNPGFYYPAPVFTGFPEGLPGPRRRQYLSEIAYIGKAIEADTFWNAQVAQIALLPRHNYLIVPLLGTHKIIMGDTTRLREKLHNVLVFYQQVANKAGWDLYETLDARFEGQVVASPSLMASTEQPGRPSGSAPSAEGSVQVKEVAAAQRPPPHPPAVREKEQAGTATAPRSRSPDPAVRETGDKPKYIYTGR